MNAQSTIVKKYLNDNFKLKKSILCKVSLCIFYFVYFNQSEICNLYSSALEFQWDSFVLRIKSQENAYLGNRTPASWNISPQFTQHFLWNEEDRWMFWDRFTEKCSQSMCFGMENGKTLNILRPILFVVQVMSDINKQNCIYDKRIPRCTKMRIFIHHQ